MRLRFWRKQETQAGVDHQRREPEQWNSYGRAVAPEKHRDCSNRECRAGEPKECPKRFRYWPPESAFEFWQIILNILLFGATAGTLIITNRQAAIMERQTTIMATQNAMIDKLGTMEQQAVVTLRPLSLDLKDGMGFLALRNIGRVTAPQWRIRMHVGRFRNGLRYIDGDEQIIVSPRPLFVGDDNGEVRRFALETYDSQRHMKAVLSGRQTFVIAGEVSYDTGFGTESGYKFCWAYEPKLATKWAVCDAGGLTYRYPSRKRPAIR